MSFFQYGNLVERTTVTATAGGTTTLVNTSTVVQVFTGSLGQIIVLPDATTFSTTGNSYKIFNQSSSPLTLQFNGGSAFTDAGGTNYSSIPAHSSLAITLQTNGAAAGTWSVLSSNSSSGGGSKNYLTNYTASTSGGNPNVGNGDFELGSTTGFALCHTTLSSFNPSAVGSGGNAFSSSNGGTAASGNLSLSIVSSGQLAGNYSGDLISSAASTAGDMLISSAFYIDRVDQAQMMQGVIYYSAISGTMNFSGTNANTFAVWVYDCTNNLWIQPAGVWNLVQSSGTGKCTFTFQTSSNSTRYQVALININATPGAYSLYVDDFSVGPQITASGPAMSDWSSTAYPFSASSFSSGFGTVTGVNVWTRRVGDTLQGFGYFTNGSVANTVGYVTLPSSVVIDTTKVGSISNVQIVGSFTGNTSGGSATNLFSGYESGFLMYDGSTTNQLFFTVQSKSSALLKSNVGDWASSNVPVTFNFTVPIAGWSSNSVMSNDTDTRVVAAEYNSNGNQSLTANVTDITWSTKVQDTHAAWNGTQFTAPISGFYQFKGAVRFLSGVAGEIVDLYVNGSLTKVCLYDANGLPLLFFSTQYYLIAGQIVSFRSDSSATLSNSYSPSQHWISINRVSGPAAITAQSVVAARYFGSTTAVSSGATTVIAFPSKSYDSHSAFSSSTTYTAPVSGIYSVKCSLTGTWPAAASQRMYLILNKNGSEYSTMGNVFQSNSSSTASISGSDEIQLVAGDQITITLLNSLTQTWTANGSDGNYLAINRLGGVG